MTEIGIKRIVSFSSEDKVHKAENLLIPETYKRWKCATPGEKNASVILQFEKATEIHSIDIWNDGSAFVEVLVRRSSDRFSNYQVLLVASSFMSPSESQAGIFTNRVQIFGPDKLAQNLKDEKWDYVKVVCTQPFNKSTTYGLTFIRFHSASEKSEQPKEPETKTDNIRKIKHDENDEDLAEPPTKKAFPTLQIKEENIVDKYVLKMQDPFDKEIPSIIYKSEDVDYKDIFEKEGYNNRKTAAVNSGLHSTGTQPVQQVSKKTPFNQIMCKVNFVLSGFVNPLRAELRNKALEMGAKYTGEWNSSCTHLVCAFASTPKYAKVRSAGGKIITKKWILDCYKEKALLPWEKYELREGEEESSDVTSESEDESVANARKTIKPEISKFQEMNNKKPFNQIMSKVVFVLSGFANSLRSKLRLKALKMGAKYKGDWNSSCTHLVCAFVNTPKYIQVRNAGGKIVTKKWILDCYKKKALLPWDKYELKEDEQESSDVTSESEKESVAVAWKSIKPETSKYNSVKKEATNKNVDDNKSSNWGFFNSVSKNGSGNILNAPFVIKEEIETEDEDAVQDHMANTNVEKSSDMMRQTTFTGIKKEIVMKKNTDEDKSSNWSFPNSLSKNDTGNILSSSLLIKEEIETEDEDALQACMANTNVEKSSVMIRKTSFTGIAKEKEKLPKNVHESSNWSFSNLSSKILPVNNFNSVAVKEEIEDEDAVQDYISDTNTKF